MKIQKIIVSSVLFAHLVSNIYAEDTAALKANAAKSAVAPEASKEKKSKREAYSAKIAWFNLDAIFSESDEYQDELERIESSIKEREEDLIKLKKEHDDAMSKLQNAASTMKEDARERTMERIGELRQKMEMKRNSFEQYLQRERVGIQTKIMEKVYISVQKVMENEGWDAATPMIPKELVLNKNMDITQEVIDDLNQNYTPKAKKAPVKDSKEKVQSSVKTA